MNFIEAWAIKIDQLTSTKYFMGFITLLVFTTALLFGLDTISELEPYKEIFEKIDQAILYFFVFELTIRIIVTRGLFFENKWNIFDFLAVAASLIPFSYAYVFRLLRFLHAMRFLEIIPRTKHIVDGLAHSLPGILNVFLASFVLFYILSLVATTLYSSYLPEEFGSILKSMYTLFKVQTGSGDWSIVAEKLGAFGKHASGFFIFCILVSYVFLSLAVGAVISAIFRIEEDLEPRKGTVEMKKELNRIQKELSYVRALLEKKTKSK
jgi:voltage-gated sodium channel